MVAFLLHVLAVAYCPNYDTPQWCIAEACRWHAGQCKDRGNTPDYHLQYIILAVAVFAMLAAITKFN